MRRSPLGAVIGQVAAGACGVRRAAAAAGVPHTTARGWVRRFAGRAGELAVSFSALAVELGGEVVRLLPGSPFRWAVGGDRRGVHGGGGPAGLGSAGAWRFACAVTGGSLLAANASSPLLIIGSGVSCLPGAGDAQGVTAPGWEGPG